MQPSKILAAAMTCPGRPTLYRPELCAQAREHCRRGATLSQLAGLLGVAARSIDNWIARIPEFAAAVREGRAVADAEIDRLLYRRAVGFDETVQRPVRCRGRVEIVSWTRHHAPNARACMRWLCRQQPQQWRRRPDLPSRRGGQEPTVNRAHLFRAEAAEVVSSLHALCRGYVLPVERVMVWFGDPVLVRTTRRLSPHTTAGKFWLCNRLPEEWSYRADLRAPETVPVSSRAQRGTFAVALKVPRYGPRGVTPALDDRDYVPTSAVNRAHQFQLPEGVTPTRDRAPIVASDVFGWFSPWPRHDEAPGRAMDRTEGRAGFPPAPSHHRRPRDGPYLGVWATIRERSNATICVASESLASPQRSAFTASKPFGAPRQGNAWIPASSSNGSILCCAGRT